MIIALDTETAGLNGDMIECAIYKSKKVVKCFKTKQDVWTYIKDLARKESRRSHNLYIYAHNMKFDFFKIVEWDKKGISIKSEMPFIAEYKFEEERSKKPNKEATIMFLDTWAIYRKPLSKVAELIGEEKLEITADLINNIHKKTLTEQERVYMKKDAEICFKAVEKIKDELKKYDCKTKKVITIGQIAINIFLNWCKDNNHKDIFESTFNNKLKESKFARQIHNAYRYGRIEVKRSEEKSDVYEVDVNNLYSFVAINNPFPDLSSERIIRQPLETLSVKGVINLLNQYNIGVTKCIVKTPDKDQDYGFLVNKIDDEIMFCNKANKILAGTWTNIELVEAVKKGYKIIDVEYIITFKESINNPFKEYFTEIYQRRKTGSKFANQFWKQIANFTIGKFAQTNERKEYVLDNIMEVDKYYKKGYKFIKSYKDNYLYEKRYKRKPSKYYNPIIPTMINAYAKLYHYKYLQKVPKKDFVYCDTDNIIFKNKNNIKHFPVSKEIGDFKISMYNQSFKAWNKKMYRIGDDVRASGIRKAKTQEEKNEQIKDFDMGKIHYKRMVGINKGKPIEEAGKFETVSVDLLSSMANKIVKEDEKFNRLVYMNSHEEFNPKTIENAIKKVRQCKI